MPSSQRFELSESSSIRRSNANTARRSYVECSSTGAQVQLACGLGVGKKPGPEETRARADLSFGASHRGTGSTKGMAP